MQITEDMLYELLTVMNERLKKDYIKDAMNAYFIFSLMQIKKIRVYNNKEKIWITVDASGQGLQERNRL